jgi:hypothetical protein
VREKEILMNLWLLWRIRPAKRTKVIRFLAFANCDDLPVDILFRRKKEEEKKSLLERNKGDIDAREAQDLLDEGRCRRCCMLNSTKLGFSAGDPHNIHQFEKKKKKKQSDG